jgi:3-deoxy-D-manno-octulosonate 8-phosphate phosphatase (KDO 8-P phosphatase)
VIELLVLDVDGCMTDGKITYTQNDDEVKSFDVKDGLAISSWIRLGKEVVIITGRESKIVRKRADELGIKHIYQGIKDKRAKLLDIIQKLNISAENVAAIGDDLNDMKMLKSAKLSFAPANGVKEIREIADVVLQREGGRGAVREMIEYILKQEDKFAEFISLWE